MLYQSFKSNLSQSRRRIVLLFAFAIVLAMTVGKAHSQSHEQPLRQPQGSAIDRIVNSDRSKTMPLQYDRQVVRSNYEQERLSPRSQLRDYPPANVIPVEPARVEDSTAKPNFIEREKYSDQSSVESGSQPKKQHFGKLIANLGMNLAFVLLVGIGFIAFAKQWIKPQSTSEPSASEEGVSKLKVQEEMTLDGKTKIRVLRWKNSEVLVASDSEGVKSMVALVPSFAESLDQIKEPMEETPAPPERAPTNKRADRVSTSSSEQNESGARGVDDRLIQMLLESANRTAKASKSYSRKGSK